MAGICCGVVEGETSTPIASSSLRRRSSDLFPLKYIADMAVPSSDGSSWKRQKLDSHPQSRECENTVQNCESNLTIDKNEEQNKESKGYDEVVIVSEVPTLDSTETKLGYEVEVEECPKYGVTSVCGRRRDMEDAVSVYPSFCSKNSNTENQNQNQNQIQDQKRFHFIGVYDGHGCSHVATMCKERLHGIVKEEIEKIQENLDWKSTMEQCFDLMDKEVERRTHTKDTPSCRCELHTPHSDAVGSTAVTAVLTPEKIVVANCGDSRAVLCRNGVAIPLSSDHKPDRPDELIRVEAAGGRVIYWDGARVLGVLAMSRAIGDNYLKPYVISEPEVTVTERSEEDECLILASDGLWDVVSNDTACGVVRMCLKAQQKAVSPPGSPGSYMAAEGSDKACSDASILLTKLALARHSSDNVSVVVVDLRRDH
ncbi:hypothetical protein TanjilG_00631 [Lupinus angustifolius]|uniref:protein-serine/threonine phosphatase n=1 Tax=Lupinus angustifolius TaxID=3871 RepID=A0A4P1R7I3_LUPAN|nr:PREDICTED: protein phosphatase 2C 37-like [Lupinus angustifolius]OIW04071.1 hypothetical protein TanjilG_00631 [Lupinus angustifolius]